jgi:hypothetical protein
MLGEDKAARPDLQSRRPPRDTNRFGQLSHRDTQHKSRQSHSVNVPGGSFSLSKLRRHR